MSKIPIEVLKVRHERLGKIIRERTKGKPIGQQKREAKQLVYHVATHADARYLRNLINTESKHSAVLLRTTSSHGEYAVKTSAPKEMMIGFLGRMSNSNFGK